MVPEILPLVESPSPARDGPPVGPGSPGGSRLLSASPAAIYPLSTTPQAEVAGPAEAGEQVPFRGSLDGVVTQDA